MNKQYPLVWREEKGEYVAEVHLGAHNRIRLSIANGGWDDAPEWAAGFEQWKSDYRGEPQKYTLSDLEITPKRYYTSLNEIRADIEAWWLRALAAELVTRCPKCGSFATREDDETRMRECYSCGEIFNEAKS